MKKLSKAHLKERDEISARLRAEADKMEGAISRYNEMMAESIEAVKDAISNYNAVVADANDFRTTITEEMDQYESDRSEKWPESDAGQMYSDWHSQWEQASFEEIEIDEPAELEVPDYNADELDDLPESVD